VGEPVTEFRYRAYISYSHADERWAAWLQRALESYRVPARLASLPGAGPLPRRIAPVFRDREDLSSAHSLTDSLVAALRDSEALILVCSPSAAASHWVNEEVRQFQALGRSDRIFCMIVDGDPAAASGQGGCFPPALFDGVRDAVAEPLAADPRALTDGKKLAKLKLIAGLLGVRLDELRQRDLRRTRRWQVAGALTVLAAIALAGVAVTSRMAQHQERAKSEQMANFIVDLGEDLKSELDLESLGRISERAMAYLQDLDPRNLSPDTSIRVGLALRQVGVVNLQQGAFNESLAAFEQSRQLYRDLNRKYPEREDMLFELGQAEFWVGENLSLRGAADAAWQPWSNYYDISKALYDSARDDPRWLLEMSYATGNLIQLRVNSGQTADQQLLDDVEENVGLTERAVAAQPGDSEVLSQYSNTLAWAADAQYLACNLAQAGRYREITLEQAEHATANDPSNKDHRRALAYRHSGMAMVLEDQGNLAEAEQHRVAGLDILTGLLAVDPSNRMLSIDVAANKCLLASLMTHTGRLESALVLMQEAEPDLRLDMPLEHATEIQLEDYALFLLDYAELLARTQDPAGSARALEELLAIQAERQKRGVVTDDDELRSARLQYLWWELQGEDLAASYPALQAVQREPSGEYRSCYHAEARAMLAIIEREPAEAMREADYLAERGYRNPRYLAFCGRHGLCPQ
jgi:hypothetical protein